MMAELLQFKVPPSTGLNLENAQFINLHELIGKCSKDHIGIYYILIECANVYSKTCAGPILESKSMGTIFQKKGKKRAKKCLKRAKYLKIWAKTFKI